MINIEPLLRGVSGVILDLLYVVVAQAPWLMVEDLTPLFEFHSVPLSPRDQGRAPWPRDVLLHSYCLNCTNGTT